MPEQAEEARRNLGLLNSMSSAMVCPWCALTQFAAEKCRRCQRSMEETAPDLVAHRVIEQAKAPGLALLAMLCEGMRSAQMAAIIGKSVSMVKKHIYELMNITGMDNRVELAVFALHHPELLQAARRQRASFAGDRQ